MHVIGIYIYCSSFQEPDTSGESFGAARTKETLNASADESAYGYDRVSFIDKLKNLSAISL